MEKSYYIDYINFNPQLNPNMYSTEDIPLNDYVDYNNTFYNKKNKMRGNKKKGKKKKRNNINKNDNENDNN